MHIPEEDNSSGYKGGLGIHCLISLKDQKHLLLIEQMYPKFLGPGKNSRLESAKNSKNSNGNDSGVDSGLESEEDNKTTDSESEETTEDNNMFAGDIGLDEIEVVEGNHMGNEAYLEVRYPEGAELSADDCADINAVAIMHRLGRYGVEKLFPGLDVGHLVMSALAGKSDGGADDSQCSMFNDGPDEDEEALIEEKT